MDCRCTCIHRGAHYSMGTFGGNCHVWSAAGVYGSKPGGVNTFLVLTSDGRAKKLFHRCGSTQLRLRILLCVINQLAKMDEVRGTSVASGGTYLCDVQNAILYLAPQVN